MRRGGTKGDGDGEQLTERWSVSYYQTLRDRGDTVRQLEMSWENRTPDEIMANLNAFLVACSAPLKVVERR